MIKRICHIDNDLEDSIFLFGARQTGKSTFLRQTFPDCIYIDLLDTTIKDDSNAVLPCSTRCFQIKRREHWSS